MEMSAYTENEKKFLAGCIKAMILSDDRISEEELSDLNHLPAISSFLDFDSALESFEGEVKDQETFWEMAKGIYRVEIQDNILEVLTELSIQEGFPKNVETQLLKGLQELWDRS